MLRTVLVLLVVAACGGAGATPGPDAEVAILGPDAAGAEVDAEPTEARFVMFGDAGFGGALQWRVAAAIAHLCESEGCDFVVVLGDNIYDDGVDSVTDPAFQTKFEQPYAQIDLPFHVILGNHDFGPTGTDPMRAANEIAYTVFSTKWRMPASHYTVRQGPVGLILFDTTSVMLDDTSFGDQNAAWPAMRSATADTPWLIAAGHHPMRSNGHHGAAKPRLADFLNANVCGQADLYVAGHDHDREWLDAPDACGGTELIVSGAGGSHYTFERDETPVRFQDDTSAGFLYVVADAHQLTGRFVDADGVTNFEHTLIR